GPNGQAFGPITLANATETYVSFAQGTIGGPVSINSDQFILASQRVQYNQSFNEVWAQAAGSAALVNYINWFDKASTGFLNDNIHLLSPGLATASVTVSEDGGLNPATANVAAGAETYVTFPCGVIGGPVQILVNRPGAVLASQRVQYNQSF